MFYRILIANRGEAACRVMRTCRRLGVIAVAVFTAEDRFALHVRLADEAHEVPSYLDAQAIVAIAKKTGADAVHPGYGFLADNADFAALCWRQSIVFIGPLPQTIAMISDKHLARMRAMQTGIPVLPAMAENGQREDALFKASKALGFPLLIKPAVGGDSKGMKLVLKEEDFSALLASAKRQAQSTFGDDRVFLEKYLDPARHIEVQIFGDAYGNVIHLGERDCSLQRRHQKIIEESPSPFLDEALRQKLFNAAVTLAKSVGYVGAGTVEFLLDENKQFYFIGMNARLQVEHAVTEERYGLDLVAMQMEIASGIALAEQEQYCAKGWVIESRILAEDAEHDFPPQARTIVRQWVPPCAIARFDCSFASQDEVNPVYDSILATCIASGNNREEARRRLAQALAQTAFLGLKTNLAFLQQLLDRCEFKDGRYHTRWLEENTSSTEKPSWPFFAASLKVFLEKEKAIHSPWQHDGWTPIGKRKQRLLWQSDHGEKEVRFVWENECGIFSEEGEENFSAAAHLLDDHSMLFTLPEKVQRLTAFLALPYCEIVTHTERYSLILQEESKDANLAFKEPENLTFPMPLASMPKNK